MTNASKHSDASVVDVTLERRKVDGRDPLELAIRDDGKGFDTPLTNSSTREFEIFCLLAEGLSSNEIGTELTRLAIRHGILKA